MASNKFLMLTIVSTFLPAIAFATDYIVGDYSGWTINFDYQGWAKDKVFFVGDRLVFKYTEGYHNVFKVNGTAFRNCDIPPKNEALTSGNDTIVLTTPGRKWYICGVAKHCSTYSQKFTIFVQYPNSWAPTPPPSAPSVPYTPTEPSAPAPAPWWVPYIPFVPTEPSAPAPAPWAPTTPTEPLAPAPTPWVPYIPFVPTEPSAPAPAPWAPTTPTEPPTEPWPPAPSPWVPTIPTTPTEPWAPAPSPYPWI